MAKAPLFFSLFHDGGSGGGGGGGGGSWQSNNCDVML